MNLMPASTLRRRAFNEKKPYFIATVFSLVVVAFAVGFLFEKLAKSKASELETLGPVVQQRQDKSNTFKQVYKKRGAAQRDAGQIATWINDRYYWSGVLAELRRVLIRAENDTQKELSAQKPGVQAGIWIEQMSTMPLAAQRGNTASAARGGDPRYGGYPTPVGLNTPNTPPPETAPSNPETTSSNPEGTINLICRAVSLSNVDPSANTGIAYALQRELQVSPYFDPKATQLSGEISVDEASGTFTFGISVALKKPLKL
jgi:hypothetical protein